MLKRILLLLGESGSSRVAREVAFRIARDTGAELAGVAGIDLPALHTSTLGRAGASAFQMRLEEGLHQQAQDMRARLQADYAEACRAGGVGCDWLSFEGDPRAALYLAAETRDLVVTGHDTAFQGPIEQPLPDLLSALLWTTPRPFLVCGDEAGAGPDVLVAYDGSVPAMRALQMFALIGLGRGRRIRVVAVDGDREEAARRVGAGAAYLGSHGYQVEAAGIASRADPTEVLRGEVAGSKAAMLVMGSYGRRGWRQMLFGSTTGKLVENPPCPLFIYH